jgi:hypothetical protein
MAQLDVTCGGAALDAAGPQHGRRALAAGGARLAPRREAQGAIHELGRRAVILHDHPVLRPALETAALGPQRPHDQDGRRGKGLGGREAHRRFI